MTDLIDRAALLADIDETFVCSGRTGSEFAEIRGANKIIGRIKSAPAVDAVEVVRCKDCQHWMYGYDDFGLCVTDVPDVDGIQRRALDFCSYGERKDNG